MRLSRSCVGPVLVLVVTTWASQDATGSYDFTVASEHARILSEHAEEAPHGGHEAAGAAEHGGHEHGGHEEAGAAEHGGHEHGGGHEAGGHGHEAGGHGHGGKSGHMGHHTHHHLTSSVMGTTTATMLMGFVAFMMALFYLVNHYDEDIRLYTWVVCNVTVSIFIAVLLFSAFSELVSSILRGESFFREFFQFVALWFVTQFFMYRFKDAATGNETHGKGAEEKKPLAPKNYAAVPVTKEGTEVHLLAEEGKVEKGEKEHHAIPNVPLKAFGTLLAHITGFAGIRCFSILQVSEKFPFYVSFWMTILVLPIFAVVAFALVFASAQGKKRIVNSKDGDGGDKETAQEKEWLEQCAETEDDIISLTFSAMICATTRYAITGTLPSAHGSMAGRDLHQVILLFAAGAICLVIVILLTWHKAKALDKAHEHSREVLERIIECSTVTSGLTMSWCFYFATQWGLLVFLRHRQSFQGVAGKLITAVMVSFITVVAIFILDCVGDGSPEWKKALKGVIIALGLLVGISWEGAFAMGVDEIAVNWHTPTQVLIVKTMLALTLVAVVLPAWRLYILPKSDPEIMAYYNGRYPPLRSLCTDWNPVKDDYQAKSRRNRSQREAQTQGT